MDMNFYHEQDLKLKTRIAEALEAIAKNGGTLSAASDSPEAEDKPAADKPKTSTRTRRTAAQKKADDEAAEKAKPQHTRDEMNAALISLKDQFGKEYAQAVIKEVGEASRMADIKDEKIDEVFGAAVAKAEELSADQGEEDDI